MQPVQARTAQHSTAQQHATGTNANFHSAHTHNLSPPRPARLVSPLHYSFGLHYLLLLARAWLGSSLPAGFRHSAPVLAGSAYLLGILQFLRSFSATALGQLPSAAHRQPALSRQPPSDSAVLLPSHSPSPPPSPRPRRLPGLVFDATAQETANTSTFNAPISACEKGAVNTMTCNSTIGAGDSLWEVLETAADALRPTPACCKQTKNWEDYNEAGMSLASQLALCKIECFKRLFFISWFLEFPLEAPGLHFLVDFLLKLR